MRIANRFDMIELGKGGKPIHGTARQIESQAERIGLRRGRLVILFDTLEPVAEFHACLSPADECVQSLARGRRCGECGNQDRQESLHFKPLLA